MKSQKGAATLYVLIAMLFFTAIAIGVFITSANKQQMQLEAIRATQKLYDTGETANQAYLKYMGGEVVPISNANELLQAGSGNTVYIEGRTYVFDTDKLYVLKDDITLQEEDADLFYALQQRLANGTVILESQGYTISLIVGGVAKTYSGNDNFQNYVTGKNILFTQNLEYYYDMQPEIYDNTYAAYFTGSSYLQTGNISTDYNGASSKSLTAWFRTNQTTGGIIGFAGIGTDAQKTGFLCGVSGRKSIF